MNLHHLPIKIVTDEIQDGFGMIRTPASPPVEIAIIHDGSDHGLTEAGTHARLFAASPAMRALLTEALDAWAKQFDGADETDLGVSGVDLVDWFSAWRLKVKEELAAATDGTPPGGGEDGSDQPRS
ncbi:MAG TPA: hypothetical protein VG291_08750 [Xanthobacteraceae bacterium]|nr:hypothetical protein [Xanthobacteraceae bacterium]